MSLSFSKEQFCTSNPAGCYKIDGITLRRFATKIPFYTFKLFKKIETTTLYYITLLLNFPAGELFNSTELLLMQVFQLTFLSKRHLGILYKAYSKCALYRQWCRDNKASDGQHGKANAKLQSQSWWKWSRYTG